MTVAVGRPTIGRWQKYLEVPMYLAAHRNPLHLFVLVPDATTATCYTQPCQLHKPFVYPNAAVQRLQRRYTQ